MKNPTIKTVKELYLLIDKLPDFGYGLRIYGDTQHTGAGQIQIVDTKENKIVEIINVG